jgi:hypothetical protein
LGTGWWLASDGKWYSPEQHPDAVAAEGNGWWIASDGNWYPPEVHPDAIAAAAQPTDYYIAPAADHDSNGSPAREYAPARRTQIATTTTDWERSIQQRAQLDKPPLKGWWLASDGNWYPPEQHADPAYREAAGVQSLLPPVGSDFAIPADNILARLTGGATVGGAPAETIAQPQVNWTGGNAHAVRSSGQPVFRPPVGGPVSAVPRDVAWDSDTFSVVSSGKQKSRRQSSSKPRSLLATLVFFIVLAVVLGGAVVAILAFHHHGFLR